MRPIQQSEIDGLTNLGLYAEIDGVRIVDGASPVAYKDMVIYADADYKIISGVGGRDADGYSINSVTVSDDGKSAIWDSWSSYHVTDDLTWKVVHDDVYIYQFEQSYIDFLTSHLVTPYVNSDKAIAGSKVRDGDTVYYVLDDSKKWIIKNAYNGDYASIGYRSPMGGSVELPYNYEKPQQAYYDVGSNFKKVTFITTEDKPIGGSTVKGVNNVYRIDSVNMNSIINGNFNRFDGQNSTDLGKYFIGLIELPFKLDNEDLSELVNINLGGIKIDEQGELLNKDVLRVDMGNIVTPLTDNNLTAFINKTAILHLPYSDPININIEYVIGETLSITYDVNLYDGTSIINISSSKINGVIKTINLDLNVSIPFGAVTSNPSKNDAKNVVLGGYNGVKTPYIEIVSNDALLSDAFFTIPITDEKILSDQLGYIEIENIELKSNAVLSTQLEIKSKLSRGIIIK